MRRILESSRYLVLLAVVSLLVAAACAFAFGALGTWRALVLLARGAPEPSPTVALVKIMDEFVVASALLLFGLGLYELFVGRLTLPAWLVVSDLDELKAKLANVVVLAIAITFLEDLVAHQDALAILYEGVAVAAVIAGLVVFQRKH